MARSRTPNGRLGKAIKALTDMLPEGSNTVDADAARVGLKLRSAIGIAGSAEAVHRIVGDDAWATIQQILKPKPATGTKVNLAA